MIKFLVVNSSSAYNVILGRPSLNAFQAVASTYHMKLKFPTPSGAGEAIGDSRLARECHAITLRRSAESKRRLSPSETSLVHMNNKRGKNPPDEDVYMGDGEEVDKERIVATETQEHITHSEDPPKTNSKNLYA
ncbi:hypothetical protein F511_46252 [Dorcoceras hygrometricum]|uniref:Uncharacterized protein n=1 Tax=Dorcoceras hygrometricum TaxID=472368 RepID=A0A2Z7A105_9LAMI|nr:hypothetical protein F511_46252 [Dorcoceras hygrometricum]